MSNTRIHEQALAEMFKALGNPHRLSVFERLSRCCEPGTACNLEVAKRFCVGDLGGDLEIAPSTLSHHLKELNRAGLIQMERVGKSIMCWVEIETLNSLAAFFSAKR